MAPATGPMTPDRWERIKQVMEEALARPSAERPRLIASLCPGDEALAVEVESLLAAHASAGRFMETPALEHPAMAAAFEDPTGTPAWVGRRAGPYLLVRELGRGGMGVVYLAVRADDEYQKQVAIKVIRSSFDPSSIEQRFRQERQILADLDHPNIARLIDGGSTDQGEPYFVMEYVDGLAIDRYCDARHATVDERLGLFLQICAAVQYAHQHLIVHRDLKCSNILVAADGAPKLLDFGIAKLVEADSREPVERTATFMHAMSFESASPEQVRGDVVTARTDVYALGVMLHRLLSGRGPYPSSSTTTTHDLARAICDEEPSRPSDIAGVSTAKRLRGDIDTIVLKALQKDPARRYATVELFGQDITRHQRGLPVLARPDTFRYRATRFVSRHRLGVAAACLVVLSLFAGLAATAWQAHVAGVQRARAERRFNDVRRLATSFLFEFHDAIEDLPGSTSARELVVRRASEHLDSLASEAVGDRSLQREVATAYDRVGDVQGLPGFANLGDTAGALKSHQRALALRLPLTASTPVDPAILAELVVTYGHLSTILVVVHDLPAALDHARKGFAIREALLARNPGGSLERSSVASGYHQIGAILTDMGDWNAALDNVQRETIEFDALLALEPSNRRAQRNAAIAYRQLGALLERNGDRARALPNYQKALVLDEARVLADANDGIARLDLSFDYASIGYALSKMGDISGSLANYNRALRQREMVAAADPRDMNARDTVIRAHLSIAQVLRSADRLPEAITHYVIARDVAIARSDADPGNAAAGERLANVHSGLAAAYSGLAAFTREPRVAAARWRDARLSAQKALDIRTGQRARGPLSELASSELAGLTTLLSRCDAELRRLTSRASR